MMGYFWVIDRKMTGFFTSHEYASSFVLNGLVFLRNWILWTWPYMDCLLRLPWLPLIGAGATNWWWGGMESVYNNENEMSPNSLTLYAAVCLFHFPFLYLCIYSRVRLLAHYLIKDTVNHDSWEWILNIPLATWYSVVWVSFSQASQRLI